MALNWPSKNPDELLDYAINWAQALLSDTITASVWEITGSSGGLTNNHDTFTASVATIWLAGGTLNQSYTCTNTITTAAGRVFQQSVSIQIKSN